MPPVGKSGPFSLTQRHGFFIIGQLADILRHSAFISRIGIPKSDNGLMLSGCDSIENLFERSPVIHAFFFHYIRILHIRIFKADGIGIPLGVICPQNDTRHRLYSCNLRLQRYLYEAVEIRFFHFMFRFCIVTRKKRKHNNREKEMYNFFHHDISNLRK